MGLANRKHGTKDTSFSMLSCSINKCILKYILIGGYDPVTNLARTSSRSRTHVRTNPLIKTSKELFIHGQEHASQNSSFDRLVAGIHVDNALELFLKFYGARNNIRNYKNLPVPALLTGLGPHIPELAEFGDDLRFFHDLRNIAYHTGTSLDEYNLNWGIKLVKSFFNQIKRREKQERQTLTNGGDLRSKKASSAELELKTAITLFEELARESSKENIEDVLIHIFKAVELWLDDRLKESIAQKITITGVPLEQEIQTYPFNKKIEILKKERIIRDPILLRELKQVTQLRNAIVHLKDPLAVPLTLNAVYKYLQIAMHFIKVKSPSRYEGRAAEERVGRILEKHNISYSKNVPLQGYSLKSRFDFIIETEKIAIEVRHSRIPRGLSIFTESLAFRMIDIRRTDETWKFVIVLSGQWSKRSKEILEKYCDYVVKIENFENFVVQDLKRAVA